MIPVFDDQRDAGMATLRMRHRQQVTKRLFFTAYAALAVCDVAEVGVALLSGRSHLVFAVIPFAAVSVIFGVIMYVANAWTENKIWLLRGQDFSVWAAREGDTFFDEARDLPPFSPAERNQLLHGDAVIVDGGVEAQRYTPTRLPDGRHELRVLVRVPV